jgi:hypothetical protein
VTGFKGARESPCEKLGGLHELGLGNVKKVLKFQTVSLLPSESKNKIPGAPKILLTRRENIYKKLN